MFLFKTIIKLNPSWFYCLFFNKPFSWGRHGRDRIVPIITKVVISNPARGEVYSIQHYVIVCQWLAAGQWFSLGIPISSTNKTDRHDITEILLKVALNTITLQPNFIVENEGMFILHLQLKYFDRLFSTFVVQKPSCKSICPSCS